jgi:uncharacterized low-complexity protein
LSLSQEIQESLSKILLFNVIMRKMRMSKKPMFLPLSVAVGTVLTAGVLTSEVINAKSNPFGYADLSSGYMVAAEGSEQAGSGEERSGEKAKDEKEQSQESKKTQEGKCGEGKCGGNM